MNRTPKTTKPLPTKPTQDDPARRLLPHELVNAPSVQNALALEPWTVFGKPELVGLTRELRDATRKVTNEGCMKAPEAMLYGQAVALQTIFTSLSRRAALNAGEYINATELYLRLALKAQAQCRATIEALHEMKNPRPVSFVQQANIAHGAQQVNNAAAPAIPRASETETTQNEQSGAANELLADARALPAAGEANPVLGAVETLHRAEHCGR